MWATCWTGDNGLVKSRRSIYHIYYIQSLHFQSKQGHRSQSRTPFSDIFLPSNIVQLASAPPPSSHPPLAATLPARHTQLHLSLQERPASTGLAVAFTANLQVPKAVQSSSHSTKASAACFPQTSRAPDKDGLLHINGSDDMKLLSKGLLKKSVKLINDARVSFLVVFFAGRHTSAADTVQPIVRLLDFLFPRLQSW